jgi:hypothetical protein
VKQLSLAIWYGEFIKRALCDIWTRIHIGKDTAKSTCRVTPCEVTARKAWELELRVYELIVVALILARIDIGRINVDDAELAIERVRTSILACCDERHSLFDIVKVENRA